MATNSKIEWTDATWNPVTGCTKVSMGCKNCYAERMAYRLQAMGNKRYKNGFEVTLHHDLIDQPLKWSKSKMIFVNSMSDLFHEDVPLSFIQKIFRTMTNCPNHIFQILTKRSSRLIDIYKHLSWSSNIWIGVSIEDGTNLYRLDDLRQVPSKVRFLSFEPLLGPIKDIPLNDVQWAIVGGESGPNARPMKPEWVENILQQCKEQNVPFFFKQWGGFQKKTAGRLFKGRIYDELPVEIYRHPYALNMFNRV